MPDDAFSPWRPADLLTYLRAFANHVDQHGHADHKDVAARLDITAATAERAERRLIDLDCITDWPGHGRLGDKMQRILTGEGTRALLADELPL